MNAIEIELKLLKEEMEAIKKLAPTETHDMADVTIKLVNRTEQRMMDRMIRMMEAINKMFVNNLQGE